MYSIKTRESFFDYFFFVARLNYLWESCNSMNEQNEAKRFNKNNHVFDEVSKFKFTLNSQHEKINQKTKQNKKTNAKLKALRNLRTFFAFEMIYLAIIVLRSSDTQMDYLIFWNIRNSTCALQSMWSLIFGMVWRRQSNHVITI